MVPPPTKVIRAIIAEEWKDIKERFFRLSTPQFLFYY